MSPAAQTGPAARIARDLRDAILQGQLAPGAKLPAIRELAEEHGVSRNTAAKAIDILRNEGLITTRYGSGAYVGEALPDDEAPTDQPIYQRIASDLRANIESGELPPGTVMPSERELIERYETSKTTVAKALALLRAEGLTESHRGRDVRVRRVPATTEETFAVINQHFNTMLSDLAKLQARQDEIHAMLDRLTTRDTLLTALDSLVALGARVIARPPTAAEREELDLASEEPVLVVKLPAGMMPHLDTTLDGDRVS